MAKQKGLGRGLDALFLDNEEEKKENITTLRIGEIEPDKNQPRTLFSREPLEELASSIAAHGVIQPIAVRKSEDGYYKIIAGERRWRASKMAGLSEVPVVIIEADDRKAAELSLIENLQREDLNAVEKAEAYKALIEQYDLSQDELAAKIGKNRATVANTMRILSLPKKVLDLIKNGKISQGHANALLMLDDKSKSVEIAGKITENELSVRRTEDLVRLVNKQTQEKKPEEKKKPFVDYVAALEKRVSSNLGKRFKIVQSGKKKKIELEYTDDRDLENIITRLCGKGFFDEQ